MKHLHMLMAVIVIALFIYQSYRILSTANASPADKGIENKGVNNKGIKIGTHIAYFLVIATGGWMLWQLMSVNAPVQWAFAKIILLIAAISASIKAFSATATPAQRKVGIVIAAIAYVGIITLAVVKPANIF